VGPHRAASRPSRSCPTARPGPSRRCGGASPSTALTGSPSPSTATIYIALLLANQIAAIDPDGTEETRFGAPLSGDNGSPIPFDAPSSARFLGTRLMIANQSFLAGDATQQAILDVEAGEPGLRELIPKPKKKKRKKP